MSLLEIYEVHEVLRLIQAGAEGRESHVLELSG